MRVWVPVSVSKCPLRMCCFDAAEEVVTKAQGDVKDAAGRPVDHGQLAVVDPEKRMIALQLYDGVLKVWLTVQRAGDDACLSF